jgi:hypothetical protein
MQNTPDEIPLLPHMYIQYIQGKTPDEMTKMVTPSRQQAIAACIDCETSKVYNDPNCICGQSVIRVCRNTRLMLEGITDGELAREQAKAGH